MQRGRKSIDALSVVRVAPHERLPPPNRLTAEQADIWREIVASKPADWFGADNASLLEQYCAVQSEARRVADRLKAVTPDLLDEYDRLVNLQTKLGSHLASLATKMRLTQQSRYGARAAATASESTAKMKPWEFGR